MKKPIIGITPLFSDKINNVWMLPFYMNGIWHGGGVPVILPLSQNEEETNELARRFDGFLFTGGHDINPSLYGEEIMPCCESVCDYRDNFEKMLFERALQYKKPVFAICRGFQFINVCLGGKLYQDIAAQTSPSITLTHYQPKPYEDPSHSVKIMKNTPLHKLINKDELQVNSIHHQGVKVLSDKLTPAAVAPDGIIEAAYMPDEKFVLGVQWHPEFMFENDEASARLFEAFVGVCDK